MTMTRTTREKKIIIIAGPNGAGKTTFAREFLPNEAACMTFVNADLIAAGLSPFAPEILAIKAGRLMLEMIRDYVLKGESFAFETTLSGRGYARAIPEWRALGYHVKLIFLEMPNAESAIARVAERVRQGGHGIPEVIIRRRFEAGLNNFEHIYKPLVDVWEHFETASDISACEDVFALQNTDEDLRYAKAALKRAALRARKIAAQTGTCFVFVRDGKIVEDYSSR